MIVTLVGIAVTGRLVIFLVNQLPVTKNMKTEFWHKLFTCELCLGTWTFFSLCGFCHFEIVTGFLGTYVPLVSEFLSGALISFFVHLIVLGWKMKFSEFTITE